MFRECLSCFRAKEKLRVGFLNVTVYKVHMGSSSAVMCCKIDRYGGFAGATLAACDSYVHFSPLACVSWRFGS